MALSQFKETFHLNLTTLLGIITTGLFTTVQNMVREKYGEIAQNPPHFPGRYFTCVQPFSFKILKSCSECKLGNFCIT